MSNFLVSLTSSQPQVVTSSGDLLFKTVSFWGYRGFDASGLPLPNTNVVYVGVESGKLPIAINSGSYFNWTLHPNQRESLANFWIRGATNDGLYLISY